MTAAAQNRDTTRSVLVVEDERELCALLTDILESEGFTTRCTQTAEQAYDALRRGERFACMVVDVNLGRGHTGYDVARFARQLDAALPVIYVSGQTSPESFNTHGVPGSLFLPKPFGPDELMTQLGKLVGDNDDLQS
jgi:DNA-binding response OmpR family regulator